jgi:predicted acetyltransferase
MNIRIRTISDDELSACVDTLTTAFLERPDLAKVTEQLRPLWDLRRMWAAFEGDRVCGTFRSWATEITVPGGARLPAAAVSSVSVLPTHRRRGILRRLAEAEHGAIRERGEVFGLLHSAEYPIYGRFGYGPATREATWTVDARGASVHGGATGDVELLTPSETARDAIKVVYETWRHRQVGEIRRREYGWDFDLGLLRSTWGDDWKGFLVVHHGADGVVDGYARYGTGDDHWEQGRPRNSIKVNELRALTDEAENALWRYLIDIDWVATIKAERRSPSDPLPWRLTDARAAVVSDVGDCLWLRIFDLPRALEARTYSGEGSIVLDVIDPEAVGGRVRVALDVGPDGARCRVTDESPDLGVHVSALGAAYLGGPSLRDTTRATGADEHRPGSLALADRLLRTADEPFCSTFF